MKKIILIVLLFCFIQSKAQYVNIPDTKFAAYLQSVIPAAMNGNQMDTTNILVTTLTSIKVEDDSIGDLTGVQYFDSLKTLDCGNGNTLTPNFLTSLPKLPITLDTLICGLNALTSLPVLPNSIRYLDCRTNNLKNLPALPTSLTNLYCISDSLITLPTLPNSLTILDCSGNSSINLPALPNSLTVLYCTYDSLTTLPMLPNSLNTLDCSYNSLTSLPILPNSLKILVCYFNNLTSLPTLPDSLSILDCSYNYSLKNLPTLPDSLQSLTCILDSLTSLPSLPTSIKYLWCENNNITCFPIFPDSIVGLDISLNPFNCLPNYIPSMDQTTLAYPLCQAGNVNGCDIASSIKNINTITKLNIYPNPAQNNFTVEVSSNQKQQLQVVDISGKQVLQQTLSGTTTIDANQLENGVYFIQLKNQAGVSTQKIIVQH